MLASLCWLNSFNESWCAYHEETCALQRRDCTVERVRYCELIEEAFNAKKTNVLELPSKVIKLNSLSNQSMTTEHMKSDTSSLRTELNEAISLMLSVHNLPLTFVESSYLQTVLDLYVKCMKAGSIKHLDGRQRISASEVELVESIKHCVFEVLKSSAYSITLAFDGWQNTNHLHVQNIIAQCSSASVFLKSDLSQDRATAENLFAFIAPVIDDLIKQKIEIGGIVADNASVNGKIARLMQEPYPWILHLPCASCRSHCRFSACRAATCACNAANSAMMYRTHSSFVSFDYLRKTLDAESIKSVVRDVARAISHSNVRLTEFLDVQGDQPVHLVKPQKTRWSSYYLACAAVLKLRPFVELALRKLGDDNEHAVMSKLTITFWSKIGDLVAFLEPFASNVIQSDQASLLDVHVQFSRLYDHI